MASFRTKRYWRVNCRGGTPWPPLFLRYRILVEEEEGAATECRPYISAVAVPDFLLSLLLAALGAAAARQLFGIAGGRLLHVTALIFGDLRQSSFGKYRVGRSLCYLALFGIFIAMLDQQPLTAAGPYEDERSL